MDAPPKPRQDVHASADGCIDAALDAMAAGNAAAAVTLFEQALAATPDNAEAMHGLVRALEDSGRVDEALLLAHKLTLRDPEDVLALTRLSMIYQHQGRIEEAEAAAMRAKLLGWKLELRAGSASRTTL